MDRFILLGQPQSVLGIGAAYTHLPYSISNGTDAKDDLSPAGFPYNTGHFNQTGIKSTKITAAFLRQIENNTCF
jgi:hypothetical protein